MISLPRSRKQWTQKWGSKVVHPGTLPWSWQVSGSSWSGSGGSSRNGPWRSSWSGSGSGSRSGSWSRSWSRSWSEPRSWSGSCSMSWSKSESRSWSRSWSRSDYPPDRAREMELINSTPRSQLPLLIGIVPHASEYLEQVIKNAIQVKNSSDFMAPAPTPALF